MREIVAPSTGSLSVGQRAAVTRVPRLASAHPATLIAALAFAAYLPAALGVLQLNPDVVEYIDIGRRVAAGEGFLLGVKAYHFGGTDVLHDGLAERAPLYPLLIAGLLRLGVGLTALQVVNAVLAAACVALTYAIAEALFGRRVAIASGLLAAGSPVVLARMVPPMSEALAVGLALLATWLLVRPQPTDRRLDLIAGLVLGLAYLARPTALVVAASLMIGLFLTGTDARLAVRRVGLLLAGLGLFAAPMALFSLISRGSLLYSGQSYLYSVFKDADVLRNGYVRPIPTPLDFILEHREFVIWAIVDNVIQYGQLLFGEREWLLPLIPGPIGLLIGLVRRRLPRATALVVLVAASNFALYAVTWSNFQERYQLLTLLLLIPLAVQGFATLGLDRHRLPGPLPFSAIHVVALLVLLAWTPTFLREYRGEFRYGDERVRSRTDDGLRWTGPPRWVEDNELMRVTTWIQDSTRVDDALAHGQPWPYTFFTGRPATLLPTKLDAELLRSFLVDYRVSYVLLDTRDRDRRHYERDLEALESRGVASIEIGSHRIFDTRPLWR